MKTKREKNSISRFYIKDTTCSAEKRRRKHDPVDTTSAKKMMIVLDKYGNHYYVPNTNLVDERNEFLFLQTSAIPSKSTCCLSRPKINSNSKKLARLHLNRKVIEVLSQTKIERKL